MPRRNSNSDTAISVRMPEDVIGEVALIARVEDVSFSEVIRAGLYRHLSHLRTDPAFQKRLRKRLDEDRKILERYTG
jgi:Arc/MetJ-type ribon-helix-helix transcriptional regulator